VLVWGHRQCKCRTILGERQGPGCAYKPLQLPHGHKTNGRYTWAAPKHPHMRASLGQSEHCHAQGGGGEGGAPDPPPKPEESTEVHCTPSANMRESECIKSRYQQNEMKWFTNINYFAKICQDYLKLFYVYGRKKRKINLSLKIFMCSFYINWEI
jgi:hypothetical protein